MANVYAGNVEGEGSKYGGLEGEISMVTVKR